MEMKKIVACNWKQDYNHSQITRLSHTQKPNCDLSVAVPFVYLQSTRNLLPNYIKLGAQTCSKYENGPYTGEVSCSMLKQISCDYVIIGHSERRMHFNENDDDIQAKIKLATKNNLQLIFCVGENLEQRENGMEFDVVKEQLKVVESYSNIIVAYEPIWAIGTGKVPSNDNIEDMIAYIKKEKPEKIVSKVIYGGSVSAKNIDQLNEIKSCDGYLIGGASLTDDIFYIIKQCSKE